MMDEEMEMLYGALAHPENENGGFGFSVPRMRNQQIFEANSGFKICLLRFHFSMVEAKTGLKFEAVFGLKNRVGLLFRLNPSSHKAGKSPGSTNALAVFALVG